MPTIVRIERELKRANEKVRWKPLLDNMPDYIRQRVTSNRKSKHLLCDNTPSYLDLRGGLLTWDTEGTPWISADIGKGGNELRKQERIDKVLYLKNKYAAIWGNRGAAKVINIDESIPLRTVQKYFKDFK